jgi:hypothetical protein
MAFEFHIDDGADDLGDVPGGLIGGGGFGHGLDPL